MAIGIFTIDVPSIWIDPSKYIRSNLQDNEESLTEALKKGYEILKHGSHALGTVEEAIKVLEDNQLFNAGRGSALNSQGEIEMDAAIMDGKSLNAGAVSMVRNVKNPIVLSRIVMTKTKHIMFSGYGALELAKTREVPLESGAYFIINHQFELFKKFATPKEIQKTIEKKTHGTVGAVALDKMET